MSKRPTYRILRRAYIEQCQVRYKYLLQRVRQFWGIKWWWYNTITECKDEESAKQYLGSMKQVDDIIIWQSDK